MEKPFEKKIEFSDYSVILTNKSISYVFDGKENGKIVMPIQSTFDVFIDEDGLHGGKIQINFVDRFGGGMQFTYYPPCDLKGMFDFIALGYGIMRFDSLLKKPIL